MVQLLYAMDDSEAIKLLKKIKYFLKENGRVIICNTSLKMSESRKTRPQPMNTVEMLNKN